jgi:hypothetical protein
MPNNAKWYSFKAEKWASYNMREHRDQMMGMGWQFIHMQRCKTKNWGGNPTDPWVPFNLANLQAAMDNYIVPFSGPRDDSVLEDWYARRKAK